MGFEPTRALLPDRFSCHTCFYTSYLIKILQSGPFLYHEGNLASQQYTLSSISKHYHLLMLSFYMYITISLLGISCMAPTPFMNLPPPLNRQLLLSLFYIGYYISSIQFAVTKAYVTISEASVAIKESILLSLVLETQQRNQRL